LGEWLANGAILQSTRLNCFLMQLWDIKKGYAIVARDEPFMTDKEQPTIIKKYANRRLYHTGTSTYVTLDDLAVMVKRGDNFAVIDAKTGEDITRPVLTQIIFEQEAKTGQNLLPINFMRQLISFYGDSLQSLVPSYLEHSIQMLAENQQKFREQMTNAFGAQNFSVMEELGQKNMDMFRNAMSVFIPFAKVPSVAEAQNPGSTTDSTDSDLDTLKKELAEMQKRLDKLSR
jgi:polyhydroxyalkanoate synthesis repressor PhaR